VTSGIYKITNIENDKVYIGLGSCVVKRWVSHVFQLNAGRHHNKQLQKDWFLFGCTKFTFTIVEICGKNRAELSAAEKRWICQYNESACYNAIGRGPNVRQIKGPYVWTEEKRQSHAEKARIANLARTPELRKRMQEAQRGVARTNGSCITAQRIIGNNLDKTRKVIIALCVSEGVPASTAAAQYSKWHSRQNTDRARTVL
jgi:group I intron endonuclease